MIVLNSQWKGFGKASLRGPQGEKLWGLSKKDGEMRGNNPTDKLATQQVKEGPGKEAWWKEEVKFEIERLKALLRDPMVPEEEKAIAQSQVANYREMSATNAPVENRAEAMTAPSASGSDWLRQMQLLSDVGDGERGNWDWKLRRSA
jgi:hypothetical protein